jgi:hypothetical protein
VLEAEYDVFVDVDECDFEEFDMEVRVDFGEKVLVEEGLCVVLCDLRGCEGVVYDFGNVVGEFLEERRELRGLELILQFEEFRAVYFVQFSVFVIE